MSAPVFYRRGPCCDGGPENRTIPVGREWAAILREDMSGFEQYVYADEPREQSAIHEVGHAAVAFSLGAPVEYVLTTQAATDDKNLPAADAVAINLAGPMAAAFYARCISPRPDEVWQHFIERARASGRRCDECRSIRRLLQDRPEASDGEIVAALQAAERRTYDFFDQARNGTGELWGRICRAAELLLERGELSGEELRELLQYHRRIETDRGDCTCERS